MKKCHVYITRSCAPILIMGEFYTYHIRTDEIDYFSIENVKGETDGKET